MLALAAFAAIVLGDPQSINLLPFRLPSLRVPPFRLPGIPIFFPARPGIRFGSRVNGTARGVARNKTTGPVAAAGVARNTTPGPVAARPITGSTPTAAPVAQTTAAPVAQTTAAPVAQTTAAPVTTASTSQG